MGLTTSPNGIRYPVNGDIVEVPVDMKNLADDTQANLTVFSDTEPPKKPGLVWYAPTARLLQITDGSAWKWLSGAAAWQYICSGAPSIPSDGDFHTVTLDTVDIDLGSWGLSGGGLAVPAAGTYKVSGSAAFVANSSGRRGIWCVKNTATGITNTKAFIPATPAGAVQYSSGLGMVTCVPGDVLNVQVFQDSGGALAIATGQVSLNVERIS